MTFYPLIARVRVTLIVHQVDWHAGNLLFDKLSADTRKAVFDSMLPLEVLAHTTIIQQGDTDASKFYILESGYCSVLVKKPGETEAKQVHQYKSGR